MNFISILLLLTNLLNNHSSQMTVTQRITTLRILPLRYHPNLLPDLNNTVSYKIVPIYKELRSDSFAEENDREIRNLMSSLPFIQAIMKRWYEAMEDAMVEDFLASSILVGPTQMPRLYQILRRACISLSIATPDLYVKQNPSPNAYTLAFQGRRPFIIIHSSALELLSPEEVLAAIAHELGHLKCEHGLWLNLLLILTRLTDKYIGFISPLLPFRKTLLRMQQAAELTCDRAALLATQDSNVVVSTLMKLCGGSANNTLSDTLNVKAFLEQANKLDLDRTPVRTTAFAPLRRALEIVKWSNSSQYNKLTNQAEYLLFKEIS